MRPRPLEIGLALLGFLGIAALWTRPLVLALGAEVPIDPHSAGPATAPANEWIWDFWWVRQALAAGESPYFCDVVAWPWGESLLAHTLPLCWAVLTLPLQVLGGPILAVGVTHLCLPAAAATAVFGLARTWGLGRGAGALAGFAWAFSPFFSSSGLERLDLSPTPWPPLFLWALTWVARAEGRSRWSAAVAAGLTLGLSWMTSTTATGWLAVLGLGWLAVRAPGPGFRAEPEEPKSRRLSGLELALACAAMALAACPRWSAPVPHALPPSALASLAAGEPRIGRPAASAFWVPPGRHPLFERAQQDAARTPASRVADPGRAPSPPRPSCYLGLALCALALFGAVFDVRGRRVAAWAVWGLWIVADPGGIWTRNLSWLAASFDLVDTREWLPAATLPLALAAGFGWEALRTRRAGRPARAFLSGLLLCELWVAPMGTFHPALPEAVARIEGTFRRGAVAVLPLASGPHRSLAWQVEHGRPVTYAWLARTPPRAALAWHASAPDFLAFALGDRAVSIEGLGFDLESLGIQHVLVCRDEVADFPALAGVLDELVRWERGDVRDDVAWWYRPSL